MKANQNIPEDVRRQASRLLEEQLAGFLLRTRAVLRKDYASAYETADILRNVLQQRSKANILKVAATLCEKSPLFYKMLFFTRAFYRRVISRLRAKYSQNQHEHYSKYLEG